MCDSPQLVLGFPGDSSQVVDCGLCFSCAKLKSDADRQRRLYWFKKKRSQSHA